MKRIFIIVVALFTVTLTFAGCGEASEISNADIIQRLISNGTGESKTNENGSKSVQWELLNYDYDNVAYYNYNYDNYGYYGQRITFFPDGTGLLYECEYDDDGVLEDEEYLLNWSLDDNKKLTIEGHDNLSFPYAEETYEYMWIDSSCLENNYSKCSSSLTWSISDNYLYIGKAVFPCKKYDGNYQLFNY